jgi:hypothetical protein
MDMTIPAIPVTKRNIHALHGRTFPFLISEMARIRGVSRIRPAMPKTNR